MQLWSTMPVIELTGRSLRYLYSSWLSVTPRMLLTLLNQFNNFVRCLSCNHGTDEQMLSTPEHVQPIWQGCPFTLGHFSQVEFTQPLGVGQGLGVRINNQYSHTGCMGRCIDTYATIYDTWEISWEHWLLTSEC